jgi:hypothetical protein
MQEPKTEEEVPFASNEVRLSVRQWLAAAVILAVLYYFVPAVWERIEPFAPGPDYRIPYRLADDYWMYDRYCRAVCKPEKTLVIGDSVVWGHYVGKDQTLSHFLNQLSAADRFVNLGVDGTHPAAMAGLLDVHGRKIANRDVILHCNLLWMSSTRHDLSIKKEFAFNHARLVPQFRPRIPCYRESLGGRLRIVIERRLSVFEWVRHLSIAYFDNSDLPRWTMQNPYANPAAAVTLELPSPDEPPIPKPVAEPWTAQGINRTNFPWVPLDESFQWSRFKQALDTLRARGNRVFVLVGPLNEHMLTEKSLKTYTQRKAEVAAWLAANHVPHYVPEALPTDTYADASHPLADGYRILAERLLVSTALAGYRD